jgi:hypothetical protein
MPTHAQSQRHVVYGLLAFLFVTVVAGVFGWKYPAASAPALLGALLGALRFVRTEPTEVPQHDRRAYSRRMYDMCIVPAIVAGALGYPSLTAFGVGIPESSSSLGWRLLRGAAFGGLAGIVMGWGVSGLTVLFLTIRHVRRPKRI